jgi:hypothetical protein
MVLLRVAGVGGLVGGGGRQRLKPSHRRRSCMRAADVYQRLQLNVVSLESNGCCCRSFLDLGAGSVDGLLVEEQEGCGPARLRLAREAKSRPLLAQLRKGPRRYPSGSRGSRYSEIRCAAGGSMFASTATTYPGLG